MNVFHYADERGFKGISSAPTWRFRAAKPPSDHQRGAYFTDYDEHTPLLANKLRIPKAKVEYLFCFTGSQRVELDGFQRLEGGRGDHIFFSPTDYFVDMPRQIRSGGCESSRGLR